MSVSGGLVGGSTAGGKGFYANQNWTISGSRHYQSSSNLFVGETVTGSIAEIRGWTTALSTSKFRQHTLNKFSTTGNSINSHDKELIYHFKLAENYTSASVSASNQTLTIIDSAPKCSALLTTDYSFQKTGSLFIGSNVYGFDMIDIVTFGWQDNLSQENDNNIFINPPSDIVGNLQPHGSAEDSFTKPFGKKPKFKLSPQLELYRSPSDFVNSYILNNLDGFNFENYYGNPRYYYSSSYTEFDTFRKEFFKCNPIEVDTNKFIRSHEDMFNHSLGEGIKKLVPARSTFSDRNSNFGVMIKPTLLEKQKRKFEQHSTETNPNLATGTQFGGNVLTGVNEADRFAALFPGDELGKLAANKRTTPRTV